MSEPAPRQFVATVAIPALDEAHNIEAALRSVLTVPPRRDIEVIVIDDHSTDDTAKIASAIDGVRVVLNEGRGLVDGLNTALRVASSDIIVWLDADDRHLPGAVDALTGPLLADPDVGIVVGQAEFVDLEGRLLAVQGALPSTDHHRVVAMTMCSITHSGVAVRRQAIQELGGYRTEENVQGALDYDVWSRALDAGVVVKPVEQSVCRVTLHGASLTVRGQASQVSRSRLISRRNQDAWGDELLRFGRLVRLGRAVRASDHRGPADFYAFGLFRLAVVTAKRRQFARLGHVLLAILRLGPLWVGIATSRKVIERRRRRRARGWGYFNSGR